MSNCCFCVSETAKWLEWQHFSYGTIYSIESVRCIVTFYIIYTKQLSLEIWFLHVMQKVNVLFPSFPHCSPCAYFPYYIYYIWVNVYMSIARP